MTGVYAAQQEHWKQGWWQVCMQHSRSAGRRNGDRCVCSTAGALEAGMVAGVYAAQQEHWKQGWWQVCMQHSRSTGSRDGARCVCSTAGAVEAGKVADALK